MIFLRKLWGPLPWMLELSLVLELTLGHQTQAAIIATLLLLNAGLGFAQEGRALVLLRRRQTIQARVLPPEGSLKLRSAKDLGFSRGERI